MDFEPALTQLTTKVAEVAAMYGPQVQETAYAVVRINIASELFSALTWVVGFGIPYLLLCRWLYKANKEPHLHAWMFDKKGDKYTANENAMPVFLVTLFSSIVYAVVFCANITTLLSVWLWIGLSNPALYIAKEAWDAVVK